MLNCSLWSWTSPRSDQVPGSASTGASNRDDECIIKQEAPRCSAEAEDSGEAPASPQASPNGAEEAEWSGVSAAAARAGLYDEHEVKHELVLGPERLQPQDIAYTLAAASNKDSVKQEPVQVKIESTEKCALPTQSVNLNSVLEQLVHRTCYVRLERTPVSKELTCQTPHKSLDLPSLKEKQTEKETDVERKLPQTQVHTKRNYICDFCGKQFVQKAYLIKHIHIHMEQNSDTLHRSSGRFKDKRKLMKKQCPRRGDGSHSRVSCEKQTALQTCCVKLQRIPIDKYQRKPVNQSNDSYSAVDTKTSKICYCDICKRDFPSFQIKKHIIKHLWEEQFVCEICKQEFSKKYHLTKHIAEVHRPPRVKKVHSCRFCKKVLSAKCNLIRHERIHTQEKPFHCNECMKQFYEKGSLIKHMRIHTGEKPFTCEICLKKFAESGQMTKHRRIHSGIKKRTCEVCQKQCISLEKHMVIHTGEKPYVCEFCGKAFSHAASLWYHRRIHKKDKYFACEICKRRFWQQMNFDRHRQNCTLFTCDVCKKQFRRRNCLRDHKLVHTGEKPHTCETCQASFLSIGGLVKHKRRHSVKPFTCDICKTQFRLKEMIISHMSTHSKPYACEVCQKAFAKSSQMLNHKRQIHSKESFTCDICKKQFRTKDEILCHIRTHTRETLRV